MLKRTKGRLLLTLLVVTGLAGTLNNSSLSQKERKQAISLMKSSKNDALQSINGLSANQLNYKHPSELFSIRQLILMMTQIEEKCGKEISNIMRQPANAETRLKITISDDQLTENNSYSIWKMNLAEDGGPVGKDPAEAIKKFITLRNDHIKYIRTSTEDLRNHVTLTSAGWLDCYQYYLMLADQSACFAKKINKIKSSSQFPKK
jgi:hypothetical protein